MENRAGVPGCGLGIIILLAVLLGVGCIADASEGTAGSSEAEATATTAEGLATSTSPCAPLWPQPQAFTTAVSANWNGGLSVTISSWGLRGQCRALQIATSIRNVGTAPFTLSLGTVQIWQAGSWSTPALNGGMPCVFGDACPNAIDVANGGTITIEPNQLAVIGTRFFNGIVVTNTANTYFSVNVNVWATQSGGQLYVGNYAMSTPVGTGGTPWYPSSGNGYGTLSTVAPGSWFPSQLYYVTTGGNVVLPNILTVAPLGSGSGWATPMYADGSAPPSLPTQISVL